MFSSIEDADGKALIKLRVDVDYPYPSRIRSFIYTALGIKTGKDYLKNSKIVARMINQSTKEVKAVWFFTPKTFPDRELLASLENNKHEIGLHIVNEPYEELELLEAVIGKKIRYYTVHGTARLLGRVIWKRWKVKKPEIPDDYPLQSFYQFKTLGLDVICYTYTPEQALEIAKNCINEGRILHFHPIWLFQRGRINHRGPFYETLRGILEVE